MNIYKTAPNHFEPMTEAFAELCNTQYSEHLPPLTAQWMAWSEPHSMVLDWDALRAERYAQYVLACEVEGLEPHSLHMWKVHGKPQGPL